MRLIFLILFFLTNLALAAPTLTLTTVKTSYEFGELPSLEAQWVADEKAETYVVKYEEGFDSDYALQVEPIDNQTKQSYQPYSRMGCGTDGLEDEMFFKIDKQTDPALLKANDDYITRFWRGNGWLASGRYKLTFVYSPMHAGITQKPKHLSQDIWNGLFGKGNQVYTITSNAVEIEVLPPPASIQDKLDLFAKIDTDMPADKVKEIMGEPTEIRKPGATYNLWVYQLNTDTRLEITVADLDKENNWVVMRKNKTVKLSRTF